MFTREIKGFGRESRRVERASYDYNLRRQAGSCDAWTVGLTKGDRG